MKELTYEEYRVLATEDVCAVTIYGDSIKAFGWIEEWNEGLKLFEDDPFRIVLFARDMIGDEWFISRKTSEEIGFINAIASTTDCHHGGMYFAHEEDRDEGNVLEEFYSIFDSYCDEKPKIIQLFRNEIIDFLQCAIGAYIIVEADWTFARCRETTDLIGADYSFL